MGLIPDIGIILIVVTVAINSVENGAPMIQNGITTNFANVMNDLPDSHNVNTQADVIVMPKPKDYAGHIYKPNAALILTPSGVLRGVDEPLWLLDFATLVTSERGVKTQNVHPV